MPRLFVALEVPISATRSLSLLRGGLSGARWIDQENYHLTLRFIGDVEPMDAMTVSRELQSIRAPKLSIELNGLGSFGSRKPRALWAGVSKNPDLHALQSKIEQICRRAGLEAETRKFTPHVTLARLNGTNNQDLAHYLAAHGHFKAEPYSCSRFVLMSSRSSVGGGPYVIESGFELEEKQPSF